MNVQILSDGVHWTDISSHFNPIQYVFDVHNTGVSDFSAMPTSVLFSGNIEWHGFGKSIITGISRGLKPSSHRRIMQRKIRKLARSA